MKYAPRGGNIVREPENNVIGRFKILRRVDGLFVTHDTIVWPPNGRVFRDDESARSFATKAGG